MRATDSSEQGYPEVMLAARRGTYQDTVAAHRAAYRGRRKPLRESQNMYIDITTRRRAQLARLRDERYGGVIARMAEALDKAPGYLSRVLAGEKGIAEKLCREIEAKLKLPMGWMDGLAPESKEKAAVVTHYGLDHKLLLICLKAVEEYAAQPGRSATPEQKAELVALLYGMQEDDRGADAVAVRAFLEKWTKIKAAIDEGR